MQFKTHLAFSLLIALLAVNFGIITPSAIFFAFVLLGSLLPDIDTPESFVGKAFRPISCIFRLFLGHRTVFHSIWVPSAILIVIAAFNPAVGIAIFLGYISHLLIDMLTKSGIRPLYPLDFHISGPFRTGGLFEILIFLALVAFDSLLFLRLL
jgi:inner membrane protein